ncbi:helix-turn-helix transcriptional regulator [Lihuaxuella thermophila]|uniref:AraC-type DNA-binding protein n=1 Tax=Lihuaxuella thermophila TaxID=1173111 RepID=A0A1H8FHE7_9BACL|nr:AraC family transcriptional regulator [Lihuaxuella thermophila]SEN31055.1 AraC-type DNA-binding protein [Lihuaxuella thermophila]
MIEFKYMCKSTGAQNFLFHSHDAYEIYYFHSGVCTYLISDRVYRLAPGDLIIMHGMTLHRANPDPAVEYCRSLIHFDPRFVRRFFNPPDMVDLLLPFHRLKNYRFRLGGKSRQQEVEWLLADMSRYYTVQQPLAKQRFLLLFLQLLIEIYEEYQMTDHAAESPTEKELIVQRVISYIEKHYAEEISLERIADELFLSKYYLSHTFKDVTGVTIMSYVMNRRINQAKICFLIDPDLSVTEAGYRVGFKHLSHFSRVFKEKVGMTPEQYRKWVRCRAGIDMPL